MYIFSTSEFVVAIATGPSSGVCVGGCGGAAGGCGGAADRCGGAAARAAGFFGAGGCFDVSGCFVGVTGICCVCATAVIVGGGVSGFVVISDRTDSLRVGELLRAVAFS